MGLQEVSCVGAPKKCTVAALQVSVGSGLLRSVAYITPYDDGRLSAS